MSLSGDLAYQGLEQLLQANLATQGGGRLTLRHGAHYAALFLDDAGLYVLAPDLLSPEMLLEAFVSRGAIESELLTRMRGASLSGGRLLDQLVADGRIEESVLNEILAAEVEDTVLDMLLWEEGSYCFEQERFDPADFGILGRICVDPGGVAERALARLDERRDIGDHLGDHGLLFEPIAGELPTLDGAEDRLHEVYARVDGRTVVHEMALQMGASRFDVLTCLARLHDAGLIRATGAEDLARAATDRASQGQHNVARALTLQWAEMAPEDPAPLRRLATLAQTAGDSRAELEAHCALGDLFIKQGESALALEVFTRAMREAPADEVVLTGLRLASEATGNHDALVDSTLLTAQTKLDEGETDAALEMLQPLAKEHPSNMAVHLLHARALVHSEKRSEFFEQAEVVGEVLSRAGCRTEADREVVEYFRETIAHLAPDRGDLLEQFRALYDPKKRRRRAMALVAALLFIVGGSGVYLWPASADALLQRAQQASEEGDKRLALEVIGQLVDRFPDSPEAEEAYHLQARLFPPKPTSNRAHDALLTLKASIEKHMPAFSEAVAALPAERAQRAMLAVLDPLSSANAKAIRHEVLASGTKGMIKQIDRLRSEVIARVTVLAGTAGSSEKLYSDLPALREYLDEAARLRDPSWIADVKAASELLYRAATLADDKPLISKTQELARATLGLEKAASYHDQHITPVRLTLATREIEEADRRCKEDAPRLMVGGHLDQADACYARLEAVIERYASDKIYARLIASVTRRQLPQLIKDRRAQIEDIRRRLERAQAAEDEGSLDKAVQIYAALVKEYWLIRFENVCTLPLRVESTPPGATVFVDDEEIGTTPTIVRYAWSSETRIRLEAPGFAPAIRELHTAEEQPESRLHVALAPAPRWERQAPPRMRGRPLDVHGDVLAVDHRGWLTLHAADSGEPRWTRDISNLEGIRSRPAVAAGVLHVVRVDGRLFFVAVKDGAVLGELALTRPHGDLAALNEHVAIATANGDLVIVRGQKETRRRSLGALPTTGVVAGHGAFWIGTADGAVVRLDPEDGALRRVRSTQRTAPIVALAATPNGMLVSTSDGALIALKPDGTHRWERLGVGDLIGAPAEVDGIAAIVDRKGRVHTFNAANGTPRAVLEGQGRPAGGLLASGSTLIIMLADGGMCAYDLASSTMITKAHLGKGTPFPAATVGENHLLVPMGQGRMGLVATPRMP